MHMPEFSLSTMPQREKTNHRQIYEKKIVENKDRSHTEYWNFWESAGGTLKKIINYLELLPSGKSMVTVNLVQNVQNTKNV